MVERRGAAAADARASAPGAARSRRDREPLPGGAGTFASGEALLNLNGTNPTVCLVTGDISGDQNAARLALALRALAPEIRLVGAGGPAMSEAGVEVGIASTHISIVGLPESIRLIPSLVHVYLRLRRLIAAVRPDLVVLIDNESMNLLLARWLRRRGIPVVFYFPPQVWFWGRWRLRAVIPVARRVLCAFRQEADIYRAAGADTIWVGHPLRDAVRVVGNPEAALREIGLDPARPMIALMPGSRPQEIKALAATMLGAARILQSQDPALQFAIPLASEALRPSLEATVRASGVRDVAIYSPKSYAVLSLAKVALQCSGTATVETGLLGIPSVITYRCSFLNYFLANRVRQVPYIGMVNILLSEMVQPEFFQENVDAEHLANEVWSLLTDHERRSRIQSRLQMLGELLGPGDVSARAAKALLDLISRNVRRNGAGPHPAQATQDSLEPRSEADRRTADASRH